MGDIFGEAIGNVTKLAGAPGNLSPTPAVGMINLGFLVSKEMKGDLKFNRLNATSLPGGVTVPPDARRGDPTEADFTWRSYVSVVGKADVTAEIRRMVRKNKTPSAVIPLHVRIQRVVGSDGRAHVERFSIGQAVGQVTAWTTFARPQFTIEAEIVDEDGCTGLVVYFKWREEPVSCRAADPGRLPRPPKMARSVWRSCNTTRPPWSGPPRRSAAWTAARPRSTTTTFCPRNCWPSGAGTRARVAGG
jgi:hypothetical protein